MNHVTVDLVPMRSIDDSIANVLEEFVTENPTLVIVATRMMLEYNKIVIFYR